MKKRVLVPIVCMVMALFGTDAVAGTITTKFDAKVGGYVKLDYINQTFNTAIPQYATLSTVTPANENDDQSQLTARQSRVNLKVTGPEAAGAKTSLYLEGDFHGPGGTNERGNLRMRHAAFTLDWEKQGAKLMFGQYWDIFGPIGASTLDFGTGANIGAANNPRVAQIRLTKKFNDSLTLVAGLQDPQQNDEEGAANVAAQFVYTTKALGASPGYWGLPMQPLTVNLFGIYGQDESTGAVVDSFDSWGAGLFTHVPILKSSDGKSRAGTLTLEGQAYLAAGLTHVNATQYSYLVDAAGNVEAAKGFGAIAQLIYYPIQQLGITAGYGRRGIRDSEDYRNAATVAEGYPAGHPFGTTGDPAATIRSANDAYWANVTYDVANVRYGLEYMHLTTDYIGSSEEPEGDRVQFSATYFF